MMEQQKPSKWNCNSIRELRKSRGLTQAAFAEALGCRQQTISEWELGMYSPKNAYQRLLDLWESAHPIAAPTNICEERS